MTLTQPELLLSFVVEAGGVAEQRGDVLHLRLDDVTLLVRADEGRYVVEHMERGVVEGTDLDTTSRHALDRFLVLSAGQSWRSRNRLRPLRAPSGGISEVTVRADGPGWSVDWADLEGPQHATLWSKFDAHELARALPHTLQDVAASIRDVDGRPLYEVV
ncbi:hypothetical protein J1G44_06065 [Cellulomonas sp. zg-ZUI199]|uniref:Uncharacterized protein n=1 Tax=Cellulomonas wangleii TaxID=2816956 RepID=A0ABX8D3M9_9CELL|nr:MULTISPECIES: hypothetical protein [Cellulomonas]MBO0898951.1 hypothetical protein [Cellulomonas sp. zg-ZUI22]MBO0923762.1 hypothetical protein [Cellulomonas wangleii]MBO0924044.1 hypothetical protein [Cellulomonas wangleii]QVI62070.1 hypothetical protein KG103_16915 [Cellulomonas wangleii]